MIVQQKVRVIGLQMAQNNFYGSMPSTAVWADCINCNQSIVAYFDTTEEAREFTDEQAVSTFVGYGWSIKPTLCPKCFKRVL